MNDRGFELEEEIITSKNHDVDQIKNRYYTAKNNQVKEADKLTSRLRRERRRRPVVSKPTKIHTSAPMIVKNEEETIENAISSIHNYVDEIIVLDTGSTDKTMEIASTFPRVTVYEKEFIPWDFSEARNHSLSLVGGKEVFILDADEELDSPVKFDMSVGFATLIDMNISGVEKSMVKVPRMFPTDKFYYDGSVHNRPISNEKYSWSMKDIIIRHWYDLSENKDSARSERTRQFLFKMKNELKTFNDYFRFCRLCLSLGEYHHLDMVWNEGYELFSELDIWDKRRFPTYLLFIAYSSMKRKDFWSWIDYINEYEDLVGTELDSTFCRFSYYYGMGEFRFAQQLSEQYLQTSNTPLNTPFVTRNSFIYKPEMMLKRDFINYGFNRGIIK